MIIIGVTASRLAPVLVLVIAFVWIDASALDGRLDVRGVRNEGLSSVNAFTTSTLRIDTSAEQVVDLNRYLILRGNYRDLIEENESRSDLLASSYGTRTLLPSLSLNFRRSRLRMGMATDGYRRSYSGASYGERLDERLDVSAFIQTSLKLGNAVIRANDSASDRRNTGGEWVKNRNRSLRGSLQMDTEGGDFLYTGSVTRDNSLDTGLKRDRSAHGLRYRNNATWSKGRGRASIEMRTDLFSETVTSRLSVSSTRLTPFFTGYVLDDTPENLDPLEPELIPLPELSDFERDIPTSLNIGDDMPPMREFGGDYRNLVADFGDIQTVGSATLFVDRIVHFSEFMYWRLFTSDDVDGIDWVEVPSGTLSTRWVEWNDGRQGWEFDLSTPISSRRFKLVAVKNGPTEPDIFLNELEYYDPEPPNLRVVENTTRRQYLMGSIGYDLTRRLTLGYRSNLNKRQYEDSSRDLSGRIHSFDSRLQIGTWNLAAQHSINSLKSPSRQNTDSRSTSVALSTNSTRDLTGRLAWHHDLDNSLEHDRITDNVSVDANWRAAPGMMLMQKVGYGTRVDENFDIESNSWFSVTTLRSQPRSVLSVDLRRSSRWVSREVGEGYSTLDDTDLTVRWSIFPLLTYSGNVRYESRVKDEWLYRNTLSWNPLTTGSLDMRFSFNHYSDTRTDSRQQGAGVQLAWQARDRLRMEGRLDLQEHHRSGVKNTPLNTQWRATWTF